jgi:hypothetical protein
MTDLKTSPYVFQSFRILTSIKIGSSSNNFEPASKKSSFNTSSSQTPLPIRDLMSSLFCGIGIGYPIPLLTPASNQRLASSNSDSLQQNDLQTSAPQSKLPLNPVQSTATNKSDEVAGGFLYDLLFIISHYYDSMKINFYCNGEIKIFYDDSEFSDIRKFNETKRDV